MVEQSPTSHAAPFATSAIALSVPHRSAGFRGVFELVCGLHNWAARDGDAMRRTGLIGILMLTGSLSMGAGVPDPVTVKASPAVAFAPATLIVRATITADSHNRAIEV